jgi:hypothetical protein
MKLLASGMLKPGKAFIFFVRTLVVAVLLSACTAVASTPAATIASTLTEATSSPMASDLISYADSVFGFSLLYPAEGTLSTGGDSGIPRIDLPVQPGTNLQEKYLEIYTSFYEADCAIPQDAEAQDTEFNGVAFTQQSGVDAGAGNYYEWERYSANNGSACVSLYFVLHSTNPANYDQPPTEFDEVAERAVISQILSTFSWSQ